MYDGDVLDRDTGADSDVRRLAIWWLTGVVVCLPGPVGLSMAVVNLMRLADATHPDPTEPTVRIRVRIPAIRTAKRQKLVEDELLEAVAAELLQAIHADQTPLAA